MSGRRSGRAAVSTSAGFTHLDAKGALRMVDVSDKPETRRVAIAEARVRLSAAVVRRLRRADLAKGDAGPVVRLAAVAGAKRASDLVPLCHPIILDAVEVDLAWRAPGAVLRVGVRTYGRTGVEMEAMAGAAAGALALYDMIKGLERGAVIESIRLCFKDGGRSGLFRAR